ncbi:MAG: metal ABC transporter substrate-binding protein [Planctomycetota bacterium]
MRMNAVLGLVAVVVLLGVAIAFSTKSTTTVSSGRMQLCATISPLADWVRDIAGEDADVHCLVDGSKDPHHFEPSPQDAVRVTSSRALFSIGLDLDEWADKIVKNAGNKSLQLFETGEWIKPRKLEFHAIEIHGTKPDAKNEKEEEAHHHSHDHGGDPHYWHDPKRAMVVVQHIADELSKLDPAHKAGYDARLKTCLAKLTALDERIDAIAKKIPAGKQIVTFHDAYGYIFERLHVNVAAVVQVSPGVEPTLKDCTEAIQAMRTIKQNVIFIEPSGSDLAIEKIAKELNITSKEILDPLDNESSPVGKNYFERMTHNLNVLEKTLGTN